MNILFICRLMSGFEHSLRNKIWSPSGSPAIRHMIETLDQDPDIDLNLIMTRSFSSEADEKNVTDLFNQTFHLTGLKTPIQVLASPTGPFSRLKYYIRELRHILTVYKLIHHQKPDLVYIDRSNIFLAAFIARVAKIPVVLRLLGVPPSLQPVLNGQRPLERLLRFAYRSPFAHVICSHDGSGGAQWMAKALRPSTSRSHILNGVPAPVVSAPEKPKEKMILTFLGRMEGLKGCDFFIEAVLLLPEHYRHSIRIYMVGDGERLDELKQRVQKAGCEDFIIFTGAIEHDHAQTILAQTDLYVCLNRQGHLSNATLEAIANGCGLIVQSIVSEGGSDEEFEAVIPASAIAQIGKAASPSDLARLICSLLDHPERIRTLQDNSRSVAARKFKRWPERIAYEITLLKNVARVKSRVKS